MKKHLLFLLISVVLVLMNPWTWYAVKDVIQIEYFNFIVSTIFALLVGILFFKLKSSVLTFLFVAVLLAPICMEFMWFILYEIGYANNDVHFVGTKSFPKEMYRDFDSYVEFAYSRGNWKFRLDRYLVDLGIWTISSVVFIVVSSVIRKVKPDAKVLDQ